jgi:hypothetical protein
MVDSETIESYFHSIEQIDILDPLLPHQIEEIQRRWSPDDIRLLPRFLNRLEQSIASVAPIGTSASDPRVWIPNPEIQYLCLDAICQIDRVPATIPKVILDCLSIRTISTLALNYIGRARTLDPDSRERLRKVVWDGGAWVSHRIYAAWILFKGKKRGHS